jgi:hypothetical protein
MHKRNFLKLLSAGVASRVTAHLEAAAVKKKLTNWAGNLTYSTDSSTANAELYDPASGTFTAAGDYATPSALLRATLLADGRVLLTGCKPNCVSDSYYRYSPTV